MTKQTNNRSPAFQFYPDKWQSHTRRLSDSAYRIYHELVCWMWQSSPDHCSVHASAEAVCVATAMPMDKVENAIAEIQNAHAPLLIREDDRWVSNGLRKEAEKQAVRSEKARKSANAKWHKANANKKHTNASSEQCSPSPSPSPSPSSKDNMAKNTKKPSKSSPKKSKHIDNATNRMSKSEVDDEFDRFWAEYPCKKAKLKARAKFAAALNASEDTPTPETLITGAEQYAKWCKVVGQEKEFIAHPTTWLNQGRWLDQLDFNQNQPKQKKPVDPDVARSQSLSGMI